jgi:uroporphyrinogen decarboxylase
MGRMTGLERIGAAFEGRFADRRAFTLTMPLYGARLAGIPLGDYFRDPEAYRRGQAAVVARYDPDIVFGPFALAFEAAAWGAELVWPANAPPNVRSPIQDPELLLAAPRPDASPWLRYLVEAVRRVAADNAGRRPVAAILTCPSELPALLLGIDAWMDIFLFDQARARRLLELSAAHFLAMAAALFEAGAAIIATPVMFANPRIFPPSIAAGRLQPYLAEVFGAAGGPILFHHGAVPLAEYLPMFSELPGVVGFLLDERDDFARAREAIGPGRLLLGGLTGPLLRGRDAEALRLAARGALERMRQDPSFVLASGAADIPWDSDPEALDALVAEIHAGA